MKTIQIVFVSVCICILFMNVFAEDKYTTKYDGIDIDLVLNNERLLNGYVNCLLDRGSCTADATELKSEYFILKCYRH